MDISNFCNSTYKFENKGEPYFDNITKRNYTAAVGQPAYLHCRVKNLGDREVVCILRAYTLHSNNCLYICSFLF
ncbi:unnamed protein product [Parnassius mnemosyne]|uniref:Uncharacterized protein n=1 Tax=Parnassius mnemosyne TaxID=213953 RepID=A0AAV1KED8_9NEOP